MSQVVDNDISNPPECPLGLAATLVRPPRLLSVKQPEKPPSTEPQSEPPAPTFPETSGRDWATLVANIEKYT